MLEHYKLKRKLFAELITEQLKEIEHLKTNEKVLLNPNANFILTKALDKLKVMRGLIQETDNLAIYTHKIITESEQLANSYQDEIDKLNKCLKLMSVNETIKLCVK